MSGTNELETQLFAPNKTAVDEIYHLEMFANKHKLVAKQVTKEKFDDSKRGQNIEFVINSSGDITNLRLDNFDSNTISGSSELFQSLKLVKLTQLNISNIDLSSLEPISHLSSLIRLRLDEINLINLDFISKFEDLELFTLFSNDLVESVIELTACKKLKKVTFAHCQIRDIAGFAHLPQLEIIIIAENPILDISPNQRGQSR